MKYIYCYALIIALMGLLTVQKLCAQCTATITNVTGINSPVAADLSISASGYLSSVKWYRDTVLVSTSSIIPAGNGTTIVRGKGAVTGLFVDDSGYIYMADATNNRILKFPKGATDTTKATIVAGGNGAGNAPNQLSAPNAIWVDVAGNIYICDAGNNRIQKYTTGATTGTTVAANSLNQPQSICMDNAGNLYVSDLNNRVLKFSAGSTNTTIGTVVAGGNGQVSAANQFNIPVSICMDNKGNLYVADLMNSRIQMFPAGSSSVTTGVTVAGSNGFGAGFNQFNNLTSITVDVAGNIYVADELNNRIQVFTSGSNGNTIVGGIGQGMAANQLSNPTGICLDAAGNIYVADYNNNRIQQYGAVSLSTTYVPITSGTYYAVVTDSSGCMATSNNITISSVSLSGNIIHPVQGNVIANVTANLSGTMTGIVAGTGRYGFNNIPLAANENVRLWKNNDINKTAGVTSLDLALLQSHILGKNMLNSPYKVIAGDVNGDGKVTALDIVYMKRLVLGIDTTFIKTATGEKRLWAFVDSSYKITDSINPFPYKDTINYTGLTTSQTNQTFMGMKLGDVNWDWTPLDSPKKDSYKAPLYWTPYEYNYVKNDYIPENIWSANIDWVDQNLKQYGYKMICIDGWGDDSKYNQDGYRTTHSSNWTHDYAWWSANLQARGMTLGIYNNPLWVNKAAADAGVKIKGTSIPLSSIINPAENATWFNWVQVGNPGAQQYVKGYIQYYADMGVKYLRVDFLSWFESGWDRNMGTVGPARPTALYDTALRWMREACDANGIFLSLVMPNLNNEASLEKKYGHMARIDEDAMTGQWARFSDNARGVRRTGWSQYANPMDGMAYWSYIAGRGKMILDPDFLRLNTFANDDERKTAFSACLMAGSPVTVADEYNSIGSSLWIYQNAEMMALNQDGFVGKPLSNDPTIQRSQIWTGQMSNGDWVVGLFNRETSPVTRTINFDSIGIAAYATVRDLWKHQDLGGMTSYTSTIPPHGCVIIKLVAGSVGTQVAAPLFSISEGTYYSAQSLTLSSATLGATIYYTTDGSIPTVNSTVYITPISVSTSQYIKAIAIKAGMISSAVMAMNYIISPVQLPAGWRVRADHRGG